MWNRSLSGIIRQERFRGRAMTEAEWLASIAPPAMMRYLSQGGRLRQPSSQRKIRLFACACCRRVWQLIEPHDAIASCVVFAEGYADGVGAKKRLRKLVEENRRHYERYGEGPSEDLSVAFAASAARYTCEPEMSGIVISACGSIGWAIGYNNLADYPAQASLLRDIFGNPFRTVALDPSWLTTNVVLLARGIYADRAFDRMPVLADALEDAGCADADILAHCRGDGPHVRGCWIVDLVLGKS